MLILNIDKLIKQFQKKYPEIKLSFNKDTFKFSAYHSEMNKYENFTISEIIDLAKPSIGNNSNYFKKLLKKS